MSYDITFCEGDNCSRKEECHRYRQLLRFRADKDPNRKDYLYLYDLAERPGQMHPLLEGERK